MGEPPPALSWNWSPEFVGSCLLGCPSPYIVTPYARCHRMLSDDFSTVLTSQSQGNRGDLVHVLLSGLENQPLPKLTGTYQAEYFASAPGLIALQQFGIRILGNNPQTDSCSPIETTAASAKCPKPASPESYDEDEAL